MIIHFLFLRRSCLFLLFFVDALPPPSSNLALTYYHHKCTKSKQNSYNHFFEFHTWIFENVQVVKHMWSNDLLIQNTSKHWLWLCFKTYEIAAPVISYHIMPLKPATSRFRAKILCFSPPSSSARKRPRARKASIRWRSRFASCSPGQIHAVGVDRWSPAASPYHWIG